jgi:CheY-like chemotaxis protein
MPSPQEAEILVVEDDTGVRRMLEVALPYYGFVVQSAATGQEAIQLYQSRRDAIAVVLLDVQMPEMDGPATLAALRQINPAVRCCFMSGHTGRYSALDLLNFGAARVFQKPFSLADLTQALGQLINTTT